MFWRKRKAKTQTEKAMSPVGSGRRSIWRTILEPFAGAWQRNIEEKRGDLLTYPTLYACINRISSDVGKLPFTIRRREESGIWVEVDDRRYRDVLKRPNAYQTAAQFREYWIITKLIHGNAYILLRRDGAGDVVEQYVLDPERVMPMVSDAGNVYYQLQTDPLNNLPEDYPAENLIVPADEIVHDRCMTLHHPLIGVPPLASAYWPAVKNMKIMRTATEFFSNNAQPGGLLTAPAGMTEDDAAKVQEYWEENFQGSTGSGRVAVIGADMKFTSFAMKSIDAQLIEQMKYSDLQICQPFGMPPYMVGIGDLPSGQDVDDIFQIYYQNALQAHIEHMEALQDQGLRVQSPMGVELDIAPLLRMNEGKRAEVETKLVGGKIKTPDEGRARFNLRPTGGGDTLWGQNQDYPLGMLADRQSWDQSMQPAAPPVDPVESEPTEDEKQMRSFIATQKAIAAMQRSANNVI